MVDALPGTNEAAKTALWLGRFVQSTVKSATKKGYHHCADALPGNTPTEDGAASTQRTMLRQLHGADENAEFHQRASDRSFPPEASPAPSARLVLAIARRLQTATTAPAAHEVG